MSDLPTLLRKAERRYRQAYSDRNGTAKVKAVSVHRYAVLRAIADNPGRSQSEIGARTAYDKSSLSVIVIDLSGRGLIEVRRHQDDARESVLNITTHGRKALVLAQKVYDGAIRDMMSRSIVGKEYERFIEALKKMAGGN